MNYLFFANDNLCAILLIHWKRVVFTALSRRRSLPEWQGKETSCEKIISNCIMFFFLSLLNCAITSLLHLRIRARNQARVRCRPNEYHVRNHL